jgi:hypothetical protein
VIGGGSGQSAVPGRGRVSFAEHDVLAVSCRANRPSEPVNAAPCWAPPAPRFATPVGYAFPSSRIRGHFLILFAAPQFAAAIDAKVRLHAEIPLVALLRLMHLGIARLVGVLGRRRRIGDRGIGRSCRWPPSPRGPPDAAAPHRTAAGPDRAVRADGGSRTPWSRRAPARDRDRSRQSAASPANRRAPLPPRGPTD